MVLKNWGLVVLLFTLTPLPRSFKRLFLILQPQTIQPDENESRPLRGFYLKESKMS